MSENAGLFIVNHLCCKSTIPINRRFKLMKRIQSQQVIQKKPNRKSLTKESKTYYYKSMSSPVGRITLVADDTALISLTWGDDFQKSDENFYQQDKKGQHPILVKAQDQLKEYFAGKRKFFDLPLDTQGTDFQKSVWSELLNIPYGKYISYGEQAKRLGRPKAQRAVGAANGKNPIGIIIPCHRVLGSSGCLTGFAAGLKVKRKLLELEGVHIKV